MNRNVFRIALITKDFTLLDALVEYGIDIDTKATDGSTQLINMILVAPPGIQLKAVQWLLDHNASVDLVDNRGMNATSYAVGACLSSRDNQMVILKALLRERPNLNSMDWHVSPLYLALNKCNVDLLELLFQAGAVIPYNRTAYSDVASALSYVVVSRKEIIMPMCHVLYKYGCDFSKIAFIPSNRPLISMFLDKPVQPAPTPRRPIVSVYKNFRLY